MKDLQTYHQKNLTILSRSELTPTISVIDKIEENTGDAPKVPENNN